MLRRALIIIICFIPFTSVYSAVINYDESIDGDIASISHYVGQLDIGLNTISGHAGVTSSTDLDIARIGLGAGMQISQIVLSVSSIVDNGAHTVFSVLIGPYSSYPIIDRTYFHMDSISSIYLNDGYDDHLVTGDNWGGNIFGGSLPLTAAGYYDLSVASFSGTPLDIEFDYSWSIYVTDASPVPLPASFWLLGSALAGLAGFRRKLQSDDS